MVFLRIQKGENNQTATGRKKRSGAEPFPRWPTRFPDVYCPSLIPEVVGEGFQEEIDDEKGDAEIDEKRPEESKREHTEQSAQ